MTGMPPGGDSNVPLFKFAEEVGSILPNGRGKILGESGHEEGVDPLRKSDTQVYNR